MRDKIIIQANIHVSNAGSDNIDRDINSSRKGLSTTLSSPLYFENVVSSEKWKNYLYAIKYIQLLFTYFNCTFCWTSVLRLVEKLFLPSENVIKVS